MILCFLSNDFFNENFGVDLVSLPMFLFERMNGPHYLNSKFTNENRIVNLFDCDDENIIVSRDDSYQNLFNESSLLITDYSSVAFDFAYLKKPVIYYQYADEYNYEKGYFDFNKGFGELIDDEDKLVDKIIDYIENDCVMEDKYNKERLMNSSSTMIKIIVKKFIIGY